jgi:DNA recombination protein RmuC
MSSQSIIVILAGFIALFLIIIGILIKVLTVLKKEKILPESYKQMGAFGSTLQNIQRLSERLKEIITDVNYKIEERKRIDEINQQMIKRIDHIIAGTKTKGIAGENIINEVLKQFPPEMIVHNFKVKNKEVEFGIVLSDGKVVPVDSKWTSSNLLEELSKEDNPQKRQQIINLLERTTKNRIQEVCQYIDPQITASLAICAVPDAVYSVSQNMHPFAYRKNVILVSYSLLLPYLLTLYHLHLQYSKEYDIENLQHYLLDIRHRINEMIEILDNKVEKSQVMLKNAADQYRQILSSIKSSLLKITSKK